MDNYSTGLFNDSRINLRVPDDSTVVWEEGNGNLQGKARVRNISTSGMRIETKFDCLPDNDSLLYFKTFNSEQNYIPSKGRLVWHRRKRFSGNHYECGLKFDEPSENILSNLRQRIQRGIEKLTKIRRLETFFHILLVVIILAITCYAVWVNTLVADNLHASNRNMISTVSKQNVLINHFSELYKVNEVELRQNEAHLAKVITDLNQTTDELTRVTNLYEDGQKMLNSVSVELKETKKILAETQQMLVQSKASFENEINDLTTKNDELAQEMQSLQDKLNYYEGNVTNLKEGSDLLALYQIKMKLVKSKIRVFKREAQVMRKAAMVERDRIQMIIGNNGYLVKEGEMMNTDMDRFHSATLKGGETSDTIQTGSDVKINVTMVD